MGYQVEYLIEVSSERARLWLSRLSGFWLELDAPDEMPTGEFQWNDLYLHVDVAPTSCRVCVPQIKYSWLIADHASSIEQVVHLEAWLMDSLPGVSMVRVDESVLEKWESATGKTWEQFPHPVAELFGWLRASGEDARYFQLLP